MQETLSLLKKLIVYSILISQSILYSQTLVINEFSNGPSGVQEYLELIAIDTSSVSNPCNQCVDIRGWIIDDNNGYHGSSGIASGCNRFSNNVFWSCIPLGTIITVYNSIETNIDLPADDLNVNDGNCALVVPIENNTLFESNTNTPGAVVCDYPNTGWTAGGIWSRIGMRNAGDCIRLVDLSGCEVFSLSYGDITLNSTIYFGGSGTDDVFYFTGTNPYNQADWLQGCAGDPGACPGNDQTPGTPNSNLNDAYISQFTVNDCQPINPNDTNTVNLDICENELPYLWNSVTFNTSGSQSVILPSSIGCDSIVTLNLNVNAIDTNAVNLSICENELPYTWNGIIFSASGSQSVTLSNIFGCDSLVTLNLNVNEVDTSTVNLSVCENELPYAWNGFIFSSAGTQIINLFNSSGCDSTINMVLSVTANPVMPNTSGNLQYCINEQPNPIEALGSSGSYTWYADDGLLDVLSNESQYTPEIYSGTISYYVTATENGCESPVQVIIIEFQTCSIIIPSAFTPDGDEINDSWALNDIDVIYPNNIVLIFNRWGNKIYESAEGGYEEMPWEGYTNGIPLPQASYYYIIEYNDGITKPSSGTVSIIK
jgi:gliding motility-associated-like protein